MFSKHTASVLLFTTLFTPLANADEPASPSSEQASTPYVIVDGKVDRATYLGWRVFHSTCHICHGVDAIGTAVAPNLVEIVQIMTPQDFVLAVLERYPVIAGIDEPSADALAKLRQTVAKAIAAREHGEVNMPAWEDDPNVKPHVMDLYAYLKARADGALGPGRPQQLPE